MHMGKLKRKKTNIPRHKRMNRNSRLQSARHWVPKYEGKNLVYGYSKHYAVDKLCAVKELELLGFRTSEHYKRELKRAAVQKQQEAEKRKARKRKQEFMEEDLWEDSDETFAFIAGYTDGGAPFGITWEEREQSKVTEPEKNFIPIYSDNWDLPF